jgi:hypothetical protein
MVDFDYQQLTSVKKMTDLELAKIEANEMHPMYEVVCAEIDARLNGGHAIDAMDKHDGVSMLEWLEMEDHIESLAKADDLFVAAAGFVDPAEYSYE